jgi:hypothetical protein
MAYYAFIDQNYVVTEVIPGKDEGNFDWEQFYGNIRGMLCKRTSYNTRGGVHYGEDGKPDGGIPFRKNYAGIGYSYDPTLDAFIPAKPYPSWILNTDTCLWDAPVPYPTDGNSYIWNESTQQWDRIFDDGSDNN